MRGLRWLPTLLLVLALAATLRALLSPIAPLPDRSPIPRASPSSTAPAPPLPPEPAPPSAGRATQALALAPPLPTVVRLPAPLPFPLPDPPPSSEEILDMGEWIDAELQQRGVEFDKYRDDGVTGSLRAERAMLWSAVACLLRAQPQRR